MSLTYLFICHLTFAYAGLASYSSGLGLRAEDLQGFLPSSVVDPGQILPDNLTPPEAEVKDAGARFPRGGGGGGEGGGGRGGPWAQALTLNPERSELQSHNNTEVLAQVGGAASFSCITHHISDEMVTWLKRDDDQLLTVGQQVYASEPRFTATHSHHSKAWELWVKDVQLSDAGQYECQITSHPPVTFFFNLKVSQAEAKVSGPNEIHIEEGSKLALECHVKNAVAPPVYIFWYHNSTMVNYGTQRTLEVQHNNYSSSLVVTRVRPSDAGTYTCEPHLATPANITVHVVTGKKPAAMQHGRNPGEASSALRLQGTPTIFVFQSLLSYVFLKILTSLKDSSMILLFK